MAWARPNDPTCPNCGAFLNPSTASRRRGTAHVQCFECDGPDPLKTEMVTGWLKGELQPPR